MFFIYKFITSISLINKAVVPTNCTTSQVSIMSRSLFPERIQQGRETIYTFSGHEKGKGKTDWGNEFMQTKADLSSGESSQGPGIRGFPQMSLELLAGF